MQEFPHHYSVSAAAVTQGDIELRAAHVPNLHTASPAEFAAVYQELLDGGAGRVRRPRRSLVAGDALRRRPGRLFRHHVPRRRSRLETAVDITSLRRHGYAGTDRSLNAIHRVRASRAP